MSSDSAAVASLRSCNSRNSLEPLLGHSTRTRQVCFCSLQLLDTQGQAQTQSNNSL